MKMLGQLGQLSMDNMIAMIMLSCSSVHPSLPGR